MLLPPRLLAPVAEFHVKSYTLSHLTDAALLRDLDTRLAWHHGSTASLVAHLAEVDARRLYLPAGYSSMFAFCVGKLHMSEDAAYKRIRAGRSTRSFPAIYSALADGRLHVAAVVLLTPHLRPENAAELIDAATHKTKAEIELLLAQRFPMPDLVTSIEPIAPSCSGLVCETSEQLAPGPVQVPFVPEQVQSIPAPIEPRATVRPLAPQRFGMQVTIDAETESLLRDVRALLGHAVPSGDLAAVLRESLKLAKQALEKRRYAKGSEPRPGRRTKSSRHIPAHVRREVWKRDQGRCTFVGENGHRCESRTRLEFDHVLPVARGGEATRANIRLRCRAHNQFLTERVLGESFMRGKRERPGAASSWRASTGAAGARRSRRATCNPRSRRTSPGRSSWRSPCRSSRSGSRDPVPTPLPPRR
jgi:hypothetical protein